MQSVFTLSEKCIFGKHRSGDLARHCLVIGKVSKVPLLRLSDLKRPYTYASYISVITQPHPPSWRFSAIRGCYVAQKNQLTPPLFAPLHYSVLFTPCIFSHIIPTNLPPSVFQSHKLVPSSFISITHLDTSLKIPFALVVVCNDLKPKRSSMTHKLQPHRWRWPAVLCQ